MTREWEFDCDSEKLDLKRLIRELQEGAKNYEQKQEYLKKLQKNAPVVYSRLLKFQEQFIICNFCEGIGYIHGTTDMYPEGNPLHHTYNDCKICKGKGVIKKRLFKQLKDKNFDKSNLINCADCKKRIANKSILKVNEDLFFIELGIRKNSEMILGGGNSEFYLCLKCYKKFKSKLQGIINFKEVERYI